MFLDLTTSRADLEAAFLSTDMDMALVTDETTDAALLEMIQDWIAAGDECEAA